MHLTRSYSRFNIVATVNIIGFREGPVANLQVLGVQVDSKLKWGLHINITKTKAVAQMAAVTRLTASI